MKPSQIFTPLQGQPGVVLKQGVVYTTIALSIPDKRDQVANLENALYQKAKNVQYWQWVSPFATAYVIPPLDDDVARKAAEFCSFILERKYGSVQRYHCIGNDACQQQDSYLSFSQKLDRFLNCSKAKELKAFARNDVEMMNTFFSS